MELRNCIVRGCLRVFRCAARQRCKEWASRSQTIREWRLPESTTVTNCYFFAKVKHLRRAGCRRSRACTVDGGSLFVWHWCGEMRSWHPMNRSIGPRRKSTRPTKFRHLFVCSIVRPRLPESINNRRIPHRPCRSRGSLGSADGQWSTRLTGRSFRWS